MANKIVNYKKIRTILVYGKKKCIYMKPKGKREYVKSKGEFVLLSVYIKKMQKKMKIKGGVFSCLGFGCKNNSKINSEINSEKSHTVTADLVFDNTGADDDRTHIVPPPITPRERSEWTVHKSKKYGRNYYYNADTRETLWNLPSGAKADDDHSTNSSNKPLNNTSNKPLNNTSKGLYFDIDTGTVKEIEGTRGPKPLLPAFHVREKVRKIEKSLKN